MNQSFSAHNLADHLFRHESGKMIAVLTRIFGMHNLQLAEDVVQEAFLKAMQTWKFGQVPDHPSAWLMQTARNRAIDIIRRQRNFHQYSQEVFYLLQNQAESSLEQFFLDAEIQDSQLQMIFACCHPALKEEDQIALTLKTVSGFGISEIARALVTQETTISKRLYRAKQFLKENKIQLEIPGGKELHARIEIVYTILYLLFNEGYNSIKADELIRRDLCAEAMRLVLVLSEHPLCDQPSGNALLSLMCFQASRFDSRINEHNHLILLPEQDRNKWDRELINRGFYYLNRSSKGDHLSVYHLEAAIAAEHCMVRSFKDTNWNRMLDLYDLLLQKRKTAFVVLNRAVVQAQLQKTEIAIQEILAIENIESLLQSQYIFNAVLGDLYYRSGNKAKAKQYFEEAFLLTSSQAEKLFLNQQVNKTVN